MQFFSEESHHSNNFYHGKEGARWFWATSVPKHFLKPVAYLVFISIRQGFIPPFLWDLGAWDPTARRASMKLEWEVCAK